MLWERTYSKADLLIRLLSIVIDLDCRNATLYKIYTLHNVHRTCTGTANPSSRVRYGVVARVSIDRARFYLGFI